MKHGILPELRNDAARRADKFGPIYAYAEVAYFRAALRAEATRKPRDVAEARQAMGRAWADFLRFEEALQDMAESGMARRAERLAMNAVRGIDGGRLAHLGCLGLPAEVLDRMPLAVEAGRGPCGGAIS